MKNKWISSLLITCALGQPLVGEATQSCRSDSEIPSSAPTSRYVDHGNGTVTDEHTGLMWSKCVAHWSGVDCEQYDGIGAYFSWWTALQYAEASELAGYSNWRLPNISELLSIVEQRCSNPAVNQAVFPNTGAASFPSSTPSARYPDLFFIVDFYSGTSRFAYRTDAHDPSFYVRLVRNAP